MIGHIGIGLDNGKQRASVTSCGLALMFWCCLAATMGKAHAQIVLPSSGDINTVAGNGTLGSSGDGGAATSAEIADPYGVAIDSAGNIYIADYYSARVRKVAASTGDISTIAGGGSGCGAETDSLGDGCPAIDAILSTPTGVAVDSSGNVYVADITNEMIRKVTVATGVISVVAGNGSNGRSGDGGLATSAELSSPADVAVDSSGNIYIADSLNGVIREVSVATGYISTVAGGGGGCIGQTDSYGDGCTATDGNIRLPEGVTVDSSGNLYIADYGNSLIREATASTGLISTVVGSGLSNPYRVAVDGSGNLYISDTGNNRICNATASTLAGNGAVGYSGDGGAASSAELHYPIGVALDSSGNIYIADADNNVIRAVGH